MTMRLLHAHGRPARRRETHLEVVGTSHVDGADALDQAMRCLRGSGTVLAAHVASLSSRADGDRILHRALIRAVVAS